MMKYSDLFLAIATRSYRTASGATGSVHATVKISCRTDHGTPQPGRYARGSAVLRCCSRIALDRPVRR